MKNIIKSYLKQSLYILAPREIKAVRASYNCTQTDFAALLRSYDRYRNWEIGHRIPCTPSNGAIVKFCVW